MKSHHQTVADSLRQRGHKIKVTHFRYVGDMRLSVRNIRDLNEHGKISGSEPLRISPKGGAVIVEIEDRAGRKVTGTSECSLADNFRRKVGTAMAFGRALKALRQS